jgi:UDP:flavonoid glycosyltransferase YjiC (YdhE family)
MARRVGALTELLGQAADASIVAARDAEVVLWNGAAPFGRDIAHGLHRPGFGLYSQPWTPTGDFPPVALHSTRSLGRLGNRLVGELVMRTLVPYQRAARRVRDQLGSPRRGPLRQILHGFSPAVLPRPADWPAGQDVVGYWWPVSDPAWTPPAQLVDFLDAGDPPVLVGFGSMAGGHGARLAPIVREALRAAGVRGLVQAGWAGMDAGTSDDVLTIGDVPHEWLLPRVAAVVHHAGAGTTAATLRAAVPSVPTPVFADQPLWAQRLVALGCAPAVLPFRGLAAAPLAAAIRAATSGGHRAAAQVVAARIATEDGAGAVAAAVAAL